MPHILHYLKLLSIPLTLLVIYVSLSVAWQVFSLPPAEELAVMVRGWFGAYGLPVLFVSSIVESMLLIGSYFPGVFVIFISVLLAKSVTEVVIATTVATVGLLIGHIGSYLLGRYGWYHLLVKKGMQGAIDQAQAKLAKKGPIAILASYWLPSFGALTDTAAGIIGLKFKTFITYAIISSIFWNSLVATIIYLFGEKSLTLAAPGAQGDVYIYAIAVIWMGWLLWGGLEEENG
jgi:membrane-associated protein